MKLWCVELYKMKTWRRRVPKFHTSSFFYSVSIGSDGEYLKWWRPTNDSTDVPIFRHVRPHFIRSTCTYQWEYPVMIETMISLPAPYQPDFYAAYKKYSRSLVYLPLRWGLQSGMRESFSKDNVGIRSSILFRGVSRYYLQTSETTPFVVCPRVLSALEQLGRCQLQQLTR